MSIGSIHPYLGYRIEISMKRKEAVSQSWVGLFLFSLDILSVLHPALNRVPFPCS